MLLRETTFFRAETGKGCEMLTLTWHSCREEANSGRDWMRLYSRAGIGRGNGEREAQSEKSVAGHNLLAARTSAVLYFEPSLAEEGAAL